MYLFRTYICMGCVTWADAGECFWKWKWISTYMHLCDAWESICINPQLYFFGKSIFVWVVWCEQRAVRRQVSVPAPLLKRPSCQTGALDYHHLQANMYFSKLGETAILSENLKKEKKTEVKAQHYNSFLFIKYICFVLVVEILIFNMFPAEVFFWDNSDLERKPNAIFLGGGAGLTIQQITSNIIDIYYLTNIRYIYIVTFFSQIFVFSIL